MEALGLDIKLLIAQLINFLVLWFILSKFLYKPVVKYLEERRKKIKDSIDNSVAIEKRLTKIEEEEKVILQKAQEKANKEREELMLLAEEEKKSLINEARAAAGREADKGIQKIQAAEMEAKERLKNQIVKNITSELTKKFEIGRNKKSKYSILKELLEDGKL